MISEKKRVIILAESFPSKSRPNYNGGVEVVVDFILKKFVNKNANDVYLITTANNQNDDEIISHPNLKIIRTSNQTNNISASFGRIFQLLSIQKEIFLKIKTINPTKVIATNHSVYVIAVLAKSILSIENVIIYWHDVLGLNWLKYFGFAGIAGLFVEILTAKSKNLIHWTNSQTTKNKLVKLHKHRSIPHVIYPEIKNENLSNDKTIKRNNQILMVGRLVNYKRTQLAIKLFPQIKKLYSKASLAIVGDGPEKANLIRLIKKLKLENSVTIKSNITNQELEKLYKESHIFLHLSVIEGFGLSIQEASNFGCKIVASEIPVLKETTKNLKNISLVEDKDIVNTIVNILNGKSPKNKNLKIAMLIDGWVPVYGGGQMHVQKICEYLIKYHGCSIDLYVRALKDTFGKTYNKDEVELNGNLKIIRVGPAYTFFNPIGRLLHIVFTPFYIHGKYDIIHAHAYMSAFPAKFVSILKRTKLVFTVHGANMNSTTGLYSKQVSSIFATFLEKFILLKIKYDKEISVSRDFLTYPNKNDAIYIPNGVETEKYDKYKNSSDPKTFRIIFVGRFSKQKGLIYLVRAINLCISKNNKIKLYLVGDGKEKPALERYVLENNLSNYIKFCGKLTGIKLTKQYKLSNLFVLPSVYEGQPLVILEAWACKLPVLATSVGDNPYLIKNEINGFLVEPKNEIVLGEKILELSKMKNLEKIGVSGYEFVKKNHNWKFVVSILYKTYLECIQK